MSCEIGTQEKHDDKSWSSLSCLLNQLTKKYVILLYNFRLRHNWLYVELHSKKVGNMELEFSVELKKY